MIRDFRIMPRASGKTTYCKELRDTVPMSVFIDATYPIREFRGYPRGTAFIIDEIFLRDDAVMLLIIQYQHMYDFYLVGTPYSVLTHYPTQFIDTMMDLFPEEFV